VPPDGPSREQQILSQALKLFSKTSYHATSIQEIANELGLTRPAFYYYFRSKDDLLWRLIGHIGDGLLEAARPIVEGPESPEDKLRRLVISHTTTVLNNIDTFAIYFAERKFVGRKRDLQLRRGELAYLELWNSLIEAGQEAGTFYHEEPHVLSLMISGLANSVARWFRRGGGATVDEMAELVADLAIGAITAPAHAAPARTRRSSRAIA
jgi:TetR/AcrR family transcriptional regulator, cholesterol catabolism regulator